jgi:hypothetical protein
MASRLKKYYLFVFLMLAVSISSTFAQPGGNPGGGVKPGVPIPGIELLLLLGGIIGIRKIMSYKKTR